MAPAMSSVFGWKSSTDKSTAVGSSTAIGATKAICASKENGGDVIADDLNLKLKKAFLATLCKRPSVGLTEVRRDGKDNLAVAKVIKKEFLNKVDIMEQSEFVNHMHTFATAAWETLESVHKQFLEDDQPENERVRLNPNHWYEINLTNPCLFSNLYLEEVEGLEQLVPGRLFTTRMPRDIVNDLGERNKFVKKCHKNKLKVIFVLTEPFEFKKYSGMDGLLDFYRHDCHLTVYNRSIPDFQIPTSGDLVHNILDLVYHLSQGRNCLVHCAGGTGRTGMVIAAIIQNFGVYDPVACIRKVKSTYVETKEQELFLKNLPRAIDDRIVKGKPKLARAIAAEHLIQVFLTHKDKIEMVPTTEGKEAVRQRIGSVVEPLAQSEENELLEAYGKTFDLIDQDNSGILEQQELDDLFKMCGAEMDMSKLTEVLLGEGELTRDKFARLMCFSTKSNRREYDLGDDGEEHHDI